MSDLEDSVANLSSINIANTLSYIQEHGLMVSNRWSIGEEVGCNGHLIIRDEISSMNGYNSRYDLSPMVSKDLWWLLKVKCLFIIFIPLRTIMMY